MKIPHNVSTKPAFISWRFYFVITMIALGVMGLIVRIYFLSISDQHFLRHEGDTRVLRLVKIPAFRGMILDRNGFPLAVSTKVYSVWAHPSEWKASQKAMHELSTILNISPTFLIAELDRYKKMKREFVYIKRGVSPEIADSIKAMHIQGVYTQPEYRRFYPEGEVFSHVIGFTNIDDRGQEGLELLYNQWLEGEPGKKWVIKDRIGRAISDVQSVSDQVPGKDITLSVDRRIQYLAYRELLNGVTAADAKSGSAVVLDVKTGEVLAMVNYPSFNPNNRAHVKPETFRNRAVTDSFEPGSTIKAFGVASALDSGKYTPDTVVDTAPGWLKVGKDLVRDERNYSSLSVKEILEVSSNVGMTKMVLSLPPNQLWNVLNRVGFGEPTGINFPGEQTGMLVKHNPWGSFVLATLGFGYGISVTPLQLARAYAVIGNNGEKLPISLLKIDQPPKAEAVLKKAIANQMVLMLEKVVNTKEGTGKLSRVPGYRVAGKTGTARMAGAHGYEKKQYIASFVGMAPVSNPRFVVAVILHQPQGKQYHGGTVSSPIFEKIMEGTLRLYDVPPDAT